MTITITGITRAWFEWDLEKSPAKFCWMIETELQTNPLAEDFDGEELKKLLEKIQSVIDENELGVQKIILR